MTDTQFVAVVAAVSTFAGVVVTGIPIWMTAYGALQQAKRAAILTEKAAAVTVATDEKAATIVAKTDEIAHKADVIHDLTNNTLTATKDELAAALLQNRTLQAAINQLVEKGKLSADVLVIPAGSDAPTTPAV